MITSCNIFPIFARKQIRVTDQRVRIKIWQDFVSFKKFLARAFSSFAAIGHKGHFWKILTGFSSLGAFQVPRLHEKNELDYLIQDLMLKRLAPISDPKNEKAKSSYVLF